MTLIYRAFKQKDNIMRYVIYFMLSFSFLNCDDDKEILDFIQQQQNKNIIPNWVGGIKF